MNELEKYELDNMPSEEEKLVFVIKDLSGLNWAFRKMAALQKKMNDIKLLAESERNRINEWEKKELLKYEDNASYFEYKISEYHERMLHENPKDKTIKTPYGKVSSVTSKAQPEKGDTEKILGYVKANQLDYVKTEVKETLQWSELKKSLRVVEVNGESLVVDEYGEQVPGVIVKPGHTKFKVEVED